MVPNEEYQYSGLVRLLWHFQWMWVGIIVKNDEKGEKFVQNLTPMLSKRGICYAFTDRLSTMTLDNMYWWKSSKSIVRFLNETKANVYVLNADTQTGLALQWLLLLAQSEDLTETVKGKVWIMTAQWEFASGTLHRALDIQVFQGALSFAIHSNKVLGFPNFLQTLSSHWPKEDGFIRFFWEQAFMCSLPHSDESEANTDPCTREEKLESIPGNYFEMSMTAQSYSIYNAVHIIAHALHAWYSARLKFRTMPDKEDLMGPANLQPWQVKSIV